jgi:molybdenum cofactor biosynthesis protein MoaC
MVDITHKSNTHRIAIAQAKISLGSETTLQAILNKTVPKGDVFEMAKTAGLFAVKKTSDVIPDCHPLPIEFTKITFEIENLSILIHVEVATIYKTGVEVEAMHGAAVVALTMYDMLKPIDKNIVISDIFLKEKKGGKSDLKATKQNLTAGIIVCSDSVFNERKKDLSGLKIREILENFKIDTVDYQVVEDNVAQIQEKVLDYVSKNTDLIILTGGTGLSPKDFTPEAVKPLIEREIPGLMEYSRNYGQNRMPLAFLSRGIAGMRENSLILTLPGSEKAVRECMSALFPHVLHVFSVLEGQRHD